MREMVSQRGLTTVIIKRLLSTAQSLKEALHQTRLQCTIGVMNQGNYTNMLRKSAFKILRVRYTKQFKIHFLSNTHFSKLKLPVYEGKKMQRQNRLEPQIYHADKFFFKKNYQAKFVRRQTRNVSHTFSYCSYCFNCPSILWQSLAGSDLLMSSAIVRS